MQVNGTLINYYFHCKRQCYLHGNNDNVFGEEVLGNGGQATGEDLII